MHVPQSRIDDLILLEPRHYLRRVSLVSRLLDNFRGIRVAPETFVRPSLLVDRFTLFRMTSQHLARELLRGVSMTAPSDREINAMYRNVAEMRGSAAKVVEHCANPFAFAEFATLCNRLQRGLGARRAVDPYLVRVRDAHSATARGGARQTSSRLIELVSRFAVHLSEADLADLDSVNPEMLENILWSSGTRWPAIMEDEIRGLSVEVQPGYLFIPPRSSR